MSAQLELVLDHEDVQCLGFIERRPVPGREVGHAVGRDDRGMPIYRPVWADYEWFATRVDAVAIERKRERRRLHLTHLCLSKGRDKRNPTNPTHIDWRDSLATMRDLWDHFTPP